MTCSDCQYWRSFEELNAGPQGKQTPFKGLCFVNPPVMTNPIGPEWKRPVTSGHDPKCADFLQRDD